jgi:zinc/manganese transport system substrate-binding protein
MRMITTISILSCSLLLGYSLPVKANQPIPVIASFSILGDMIQTVGGDAVSVTTLVGPDSDAHGYQPTSDNLKAVSAAQIVFVNGLGFDSWMDKLANSAAYHGKIAIATTGIQPRTMIEAENGAQPETITDPHAWQDLRNGLVYVDNITATLSQALPDQASAIQQRANAYKNQIKALDADIRTRISALPAEKRIVMTSHDAFGYFGAAYGIKFEAPYGLSTETEPSAKAIARLVDQMRQTGVKTVFMENMTNPKLIEQLGKDGGATLGGTLYADALSPAKGAAPTYLLMFKHNLSQLLPAMHQVVIP